MAAFGGRGRDNPRSPFGGQKAEKVPPPLGKVAVAPLPARPGEDQKLLQLVCQKIKAAAYTSGGQDWEKLFREQDKDKSGEIDWNEFYSMCRRVLKLKESEAQLRQVFAMLDEDGSGEASIEELIALVKEKSKPEKIRKYKYDSGPVELPKAPLPPKKEDLEKLSAEEADDLIRKVAARCKAAAFTTGGKDWEKLFREQDKDRSGEISWDEFNSMCRRVLKLKDPESHLKAIFNALDDDGSGEVSIDELVKMVSEGAPPKQVERINGVRVARTRGDAQDAAAAGDDGRPHTPRDVAAQIAEIHSQEKSKSKPKPAPKKVESRAELIAKVFGACDRGWKRLDSDGLLKFARSLGAEFNKASWAAEYADVCYLVGAKQAVGLDLAQFTKLVDDANAGIYCSDKDLRSLAGRLEVAGQQVQKVPGLEVKLDNRLNSDKAEKKNDAAVLIQTSFRGFATRKAFKEKLAVLREQRRAEIQAKINARKPVVEDPKGLLKKKGSAHPPAEPQSAAHPTAAQPAVATPPVAHPAHHAPPVHDKHHAHPPAHTVQDKHHPHLVHVEHPDHHHLDPKQREELLRRQQERADRLAAPKDKVHQERTKAFHQYANAPTVNFKDKSHDSISSISTSPSTTDPGGPEQKVTLAQTQPGGGVVKMKTQPIRLQMAAPAEQGETPPPGPRAGGDSPRGDPPKSRGAAPLQPTLHSPRSGQTSRAPGGATRSPKASPRPRSASPPREAPQGQGRAGLPAGNIDERLASAEYVFGGKDWVKIFREAGSKDPKGSISWAEFYSLCNRVLKLKFNKDELQEMFRSLEMGNSRKAPVKDIVAMIKQAWDDQQKPKPKPPPVVKPKPEKKAPPPPSPGPSADDFIRAVNARDEQAAIDLLGVWEHLNTVDFQGCTALHTAAERGMDKLCEAILSNEHFSEASRGDFHGFTALHRAARSGQTEVVALLLNHMNFRESVDARNNDGHTALHCAALHGQAKVCEMLLTAKGRGDNWMFWRVNAQDNNGRTALHCAAQRHYAHVVKVIVENIRFTKANQKDRCGKTAFDVANDEVKHILRVQAYRRDKKAKASPDGRARERRDRPRSASPARQTSRRAMNRPRSQSPRSPGSPGSPGTPRVRRKAPKILKVNEEEAFNRAADLMMKMCARVRAAAYTHGGIDWPKFFRIADKDHSGEISWEEFHTMCRKQLRLTETDAELRGVFNSLDSDSSGQVSIEELVATVQDPIERMRLRLRDAIEVRYGGNLQLFLDSQGDSGARGAGILTFSCFRDICRKSLFLPDTDVQLQLFFRQIDDDNSGEVCLGELVAFLRGE